MSLNTVVEKLKASSASSSTESNNEIEKPREQQQAVMSSSAMSSRMSDGSSSDYSKVDFSAAAIKKRVSFFQFPAVVKQFACCAKFLFRNVSWTGLPTHLNSLKQKSRALRGKGARWLVAPSEMLRERLLKAFHAIFKTRRINLSKQLTKGTLKSKNLNITWTSALKLKKPQRLRKHHQKWPNHHRRKLQSEKEPDRKILYAQSMRAMMNFSMAGNQLAKLSSDRFWNR